MTSYAICPVCRLRMECSAEAQFLRCDRCQHVFERSEPDVPTAMAADAPVESIPEALPADQAPGRFRDSVTGSPDGVLWWQGNYVRGLTVQAGVVVLRPEFVAFIPAAKAKNLIGALAGGLASAASPIQTIPLDWLRHRPDPLQMVNDLWAERPDDFDRCLFEIVEHLGGFIWARSAARVARPAKATTGHSEGLMFVRHEAELRGYAPAGSVLDRLLSAWQETAPSARSDVIGLLVVSVLPLLLAAALFVGSLLTPDIPAWAPLIGLGLAGLLYLIAGIKVMWLRLRQRGKPQSTDPS
jgi:hypothetical protein